MAPSARLGRSMSGDGDGIVEALAWLDDEELPPGPLPPEARANEVGNVKDEVLEATFEIDAQIVSADGASESANPTSGRDGPEDPDGDLDDDDADAASTLSEATMAKRCEVCGCTPRQPTALDQQHSATGLRPWGLRRHWGPLCKWCKKATSIRWPFYSASRFVQFLSAHPDNRAMAQMCYWSYYTLREEGRTQATGPSKGPAYQGPSEGARASCKERSFDRHFALQLSFEGAPTIAPLLSPAVKRRTSERFGLARIGSPPTRSVGCEALGGATGLRLKCKFGPSKRNFA